jgi:Tfp pilus assembly protein PilN
MIKINLISDLQDKKVKAKKVNSYATIGSVAFVVVILAIILFIWGVTVAERTIAANTNKEIATVQTELEQYKELEAVVISLEKGLASAKTILNGKDNWTKLLTHIEASTPGDVQYTKLGLTDSKITGDLNGKDVNSIARTIESYKGYKVMVLSGTGDQGNTVTIDTNGTTGTTKITADKKWVYSVPVDPAKDQAITILIKDPTGANQDTTAKVTYTAADHKIVTEGGVAGTIKNLFSAVESTGYTKDPSGSIKFSITMNFDGSDLW